jgi:hypothetical protein
VQDGDIGGLESKPDAERAPSLTNASWRAHELSVRTHDSPVVNRLQIINIGRREVGASRILTEGSGEARAPPFPSLLLLLLLLLLTLILAFMRHGEGLSLHRKDVRKAQDEARDAPSRRDPSSAPRPRPGRSVCYGGGRGDSSQYAKLWWKGVD